jgi:hypothetical protein
MTAESSPQPSALNGWSVRLLLAALLAFGSEILLWTNPPGRTLLDVILLIPGYLALSAILLDFIARYRINDIYGLMTLGGVYSLCASVLLNPAATLTEIPRTLITRVMGAHAFLGLEMLALFLALTGGARRGTQRLLLMGCGVVGLAWGIWVRWWPQGEAGYGDVSLIVMLIYGGIGLALLVGLLYAVAPRTVGLAPDSLKLSRPFWGIILLVLIALFIVHLLQNVYDPGALVLAALILTVCWAILWFRGRSKGRMFLDGRVPVQLLPQAWLARALVIFGAVCIFAYNLPLIQVQEINQLSLIGLGFTAYGLAWLPTVSLVLGLQAYVRQIEASRRV